MFNFRKLTLDDRNSINQFTAKFPPYSDFNFTSLWSYNTEDDAEFYLDKDFFIIKMRDYITNLPFYSFLTKENSQNVTSYLLDKAKQENLEQSLRLVPEHSLVGLLSRESLWNIVEDRDSFDYILSIEDISNLKGPHYEHQRWHINQFKKLYGSYVIKITNCKNRLEHEDILQLFSKWASLRTDQDTQHERIAIERLLNCIDSLEIINVSIWVDNNLAGFALIEKLPNKYAIGHFMKGDISYKGVYDMLYSQVALHLKEIGFSFLNYEQDAGILRLRKAKESWNPINFLKKYNITKALT